MCWCKDQGQVYILCLCRAKVFANAQHFGVTDHLVDSAEAKFGHNGSQFIGDVVEEVNDMLWRAGKFLAQLWVLSCNTDWAGVQMTSEDVSKQENELLDMDLRVFLGGF